MIIKVCGMREAENIRAVEQSGADWTGFIFYPKSPRFVKEVPKYLPGKTKKIGVFVNESNEKIIETVARFQLDMVQLHGGESPEFCDELAKNGIRIIKVFSVGTESFPSENVSRYEGKCDYFLFDTQTAEYGGSGRKFDWHVLSEYRGNTPFLLSGGISPDDIEEIREFSHPQFVGIDINSRFESAPAQKNIPLLKLFIDKIKKQNMNRIDLLFQRKNGGILSLFFTAGYPKLNDTVSVIEALEKNGADLIEIGIPFSDPMADGPVIQASNTVALNNGMSVKLLFEQLSGIREKVSLPLILMGYLNPIMQYGFEKFCAKAAECGVDGIIIPDLPFAEYIDSYKAIAEKNGLHVIMLITPETSEERIRLIDENTKGFIYMVSSASVTGAKKTFGENNLAYFRRVNAMKLRNPRLIGFGISNKATFDAACEESSGAIIGSRFVTLLDSEPSVDAAVRRLLSDIS